MARKFISRFLLSSIGLIFLTASIINAASEPLRPLNQQVNLPARMAAAFSFPAADPRPNIGTGPNSSKIILNSYSLSSNLDILGYTTYDLQHITTMARQLEHRGSGILHFGWTAQDTDIYGLNRGIGYQAYDFNACDFVFTFGGIRIDLSTADNAGYVGADAGSAGCAIVSAHQLSEASDYLSVCYWDYCAAGPAYGVFTPDNPSDFYGWGSNSGTGPDNYNIWPKAEWQVGTESVLHMVACESNSENNFQSISYYRRVGPYGAYSGIWSGQRVIDSVTSVNPTIVASPISDRVAVVWAAPAEYRRDQPGEFNNQYGNDIWYAVSDNQGADWAADTVSTSLGAASIAHGVDLGIYEGGNITSYDSLDDFKAYCEISALFSSEDELHIAWSGRRWDGNRSIFRRQGAIFHWAENTPDIIRAVVMADWDTGGECYGQTWATDVGKMSLSECDGKFYLLFTQFGTLNNPCGDVDLETHRLNGYLYMSAYDPAVTLRWDRPQRITATPETPDGCTAGNMSGPGTCNSEYWASMARYGRIDSCQYAGQHVLDILYINDYAPGSSVMDSPGTWTINPVVWKQVPCRDVVGEIVYHDDAGWGLGLCYSGEILFLNPSDVDSFQVTLINMGTIANNFTAAAFIDSSNSTTNGAQTTVSINPASGVIPPEGYYFGWGAISLTVTLTTDQETAFSTVYGHLVITHEGAGSPRIIPFCINIGEGPWPPMTYTLETDCKRLRVSADGNLSGNTANASFDFIADPDDCANLYLYDGSPIICYESAGERRCFFTGFGNDYVSDRALRPTEAMIIDSTTSEAYTHATALTMTADSAIGLQSEFYVPKAAEYCGFVVQRLIFWNRTEASLPGVAVGEVLDWDIPAYNKPMVNGSGFDVVRGLIYQYACGQDPCDTTVLSERFGGVSAITDYMPFKNLQTIENDRYLYSTGPFGTPLPSDTIYGLMTGVNGFDLADIDTCEDLSTLVTTGVYDLDPGDTLCAFLILFSSRSGLSGMLGDYDLALEFLMQHDEIGQCPWSPPCSCRPGDANGDSVINVGDAVYLINYVFKEGPPPTPYAICSGDANGDCTCNIGDAVFLINLIFKDGPPPPSCMEWLGQCYTIE